jgi:hypothetical protein
LSTHTNCARTTYAGITDGRITRVSSPRVRGNYAYRFYLRDGDSCYGERAEVGQDNPRRSDMLNRLFREGEERWISFQVRLGEGFPIDTTTWQIVMQLKQQGAYGSPVTEMDAHKG